MAKLLPVQAQLSVLTAFSALFALIFQPSFPVLPTRSLFFYQILSMRKTLLLSMLLSHSPLAVPDKNTLPQPVLLLPFHLEHTLFPILKTKRPLEQQHRHLPCQNFKYLMKFHIPSDSAFQNL